MDRNLLFRELSGLCLYPGSRLYAPSRERETVEHEFDVSLGSSFTLEIDLGLTPKVTGVFIPKGFQDPAEVDAIVYFHGDIGGEKPEPSMNTKAFKNKGTDIYWNHPVFPLREQLASSKKSAVLIVPTFSGKSVGNLSDNKGFEKFMDDFLAQMIGQNKFAAGTKIRNLILAGHSRGGNRMSNALKSAGKYTSNIMECWGFDSLFNSGDKPPFIKWLQSDANHIFYHYSTDYSSSPKSNARSLGKKIKNGNAIIEHNKEDADKKVAHFKVVRNHFEECIKRCALLKDVYGGLSLGSMGSLTKTVLLAWALPKPGLFDQIATRAWYERHKNNKKFHPNEPANNVDQFPVPPWINKNEIFKSWEEAFRTDNPQYNEASIIIGNRDEQVDAQYFVIHDTAGYTDYTAKNAKDNIHLWLGINSCYLATDWAKPGVGTKIEIGKRNRCFVHTELTRHSKKVQEIPDIKGYLTLYTYRQYKLLAFAYIVNSLRKGRFLTVTIHREVDRGIVRRWTEKGEEKVSYGHNDPQYFNIDYFYKLVNLALGLQGFTYGIQKDRVLAYNTRNLDGHRNEFIPYILGEVDSANQYGEIGKGKSSGQAPPKRFARDCVGRK